MEICRAGCRAVVPRQPPNGNPQCGCHGVTALQTTARQSYSRDGVHTVSTNKTISFHHEFPRDTTHGDEIHALWQITNINLLFFRHDLAFLHGLANGIHYAVGFHW